jgi:hypothetical protein
MLNDDEESLHELNFGQGPRTSGTLVTHVSVAQTVPATLPQINCKVSSRVVYASMTKWPMKSLIHSPRRIDSAEI